jgi:hypothetical protein
MQTFLRKDRKQIRLNETLNEAKNPTLRSKKPEGKQMALNLNKLKNNGNSGGPRRSTIALELVRVEQKDPKKATPGEDVGIFRMRHPAEGFPEYTEDDKGAPTTEIKMILEKREIRGEHAPLEFADFRRGKGQTKPVAAGGVIILENASYDSRKGVGSARWARIATHAPEGPTENSPNDHLISVGKETYEDVDGERRYRQLRYLAIPTDAQTFTSLEEFKKIASDLLIAQPDIGGDKPGVWVRILNTKDPLNDRVTTSIRLGWKAAEGDAPGRQMTPEESVENFLNSPRMADWVDNISQAGTPDAADYVFEVIPHFWWYTGEKSLPKGKPRSDANDYQIPVEGSNKTFSGFAKSHMILKRKITPAQGNEPEEIGNWFASGTMRVNRFDAIFPREEIVTPNLPKPVADLFAEVAESRGKQSLDAIRANKEQAPKTDAADEDLGFADPDHSPGGVTPK